MCSPLLGALVALGSLVALAAFASPVAGEEAWPERMGDLVTTGIEVGGQKVSLEGPKVDPRQPAQDRLASQDRLAGAHGWKRFSRNSVVAPVKIELAYVKDETGQRVGHRIHLAYVVHAGLDTLRDSDLMSDLFGSPSDESSTQDSGQNDESKEEQTFRSEQIEPDALPELQIESENDVSFGWLEFLLLKKVELKGVIRSQRWEQDDFVAVAWELEERFTDRDPAHEQYRNQWIRRDRDASGNLVRSDPESYSGAAGYLLISAVEGLEDASLIEAEVLLHEPEGWFNGSNLFRSKLPLILQESARRFRRGLK